MKFNKFNKWTARNAITGYNSYDRRSVVNIHYLLKQIWKYNLKNKSCSLIVICNNHKNMFEVLL